MISRVSLLFALILVLTPLSPVRAEPQQEWNFNVLLDGDPIGTQSFQRTVEGETSRVRIQAEFSVKILFLTVYTYSHRNVEVWENGCLRSMDATTDDNGEKFRVRAEESALGVQVETLQGKETLPPCVTSFAYWDPERLEAGRLLNSQTGEYESVRAREMGEEKIRFEGKEVPARRLALEGDKLKIDLWYSKAGDWLALESTTTSGRRLKYVRG